MKMTNADQQNCTVHPSDWMTILPSAMAELGLQGFFSSEAMSCAMSIALAEAIAGQGVEYECHLVYGEDFVLIRLDGSPELYDADGLNWNHLNVDYTDTKVVTLDEVIKHAEFLGMPPDELATHVSKARGVTEKAMLMAQENVERFGYFCPA
jgi:hypothetical protein